MKNTIRKLKRSAIASLLLLVLIVPFLVERKMKMEETAQYVLVVQQYLNIVLPLCVAVLFFCCFYEKTQGKGRELFYLTDRGCGKELFLIYTIIAGSLGFSVLLFYHSHIAQPGIFFLQYLILVYSLLSFCYALLYVTSHIVVVLLGVLLFYGMLLTGAGGTGTLFLYPGEQSVTIRALCYAMRYELLLGVFSNLIGIFANKRYTSY